MNLNFTKNLLDPNVFDVFCWGGGGGGGDNFFRASLYVWYLH